MVTKADTKWKVLTVVKITMLKTKGMSTVNTNISFSFLLLFFFFFFFYTPLQQCVKPPLNDICVKEMGIKFTLLICSKDFKFYYIP